MVGIINNLGKKNYFNDYADTNYLVNWLIISD